MTTPATGRCRLCQQSRPLFPFNDSDDNYDLCSPCWQKAEAADAAGDPLDLYYLCFKAKANTSSVSAKGWTGYATTRTT